MTFTFDSIRTFSLGATLSIALVPSIWSVDVAAANISGRNATDFNSRPVTSTESVKPQVMLTMSRDHQYFFKAYNDYTDLDPENPTPDGIETTYKNTFEYYGYFHPDFCYDYEAANFPNDGFGTYEMFRPKGIATNHYCDAVAGEWSGNFLNWASMTRMDIVRKILYGGLRRTDTRGRTVLERAHLPSDVHSFAKYYNGSDLARLTPFGSVRKDGDAGDPRPGFDDANEGITICNTTEPTSSGNSQTSTSPPQMRIAAGNFQLWNAEEVLQCHWRRGTGGSSAEFGSTTTGDGNGNDPATSGIDAQPLAPQYNGDGLKGGPSNSPNYNVFVEVCREGLPPHDASNNKENCRNYGNAPSFRLKPTGLLQEYGEKDIDFGLMTGSFANNTHGGVLRKNIGPISDEVNGNGTFVEPAGSTTPAVGIIRTLDKLRVYGYRFTSNRTANRYFDSGSGDDCPFQLREIPEGRCNSWGNPISEIYAESIRYFAGLSPTPAFSQTAGGPVKDDDFIEGLDEANWDNANTLNSNNFCAALNTVVFNASLSSYDDDDGVAAFGDIPGSPNAVSLTNDVGTAEGYDNKDFFIGKTGSQNDEFCTPKTLATLGSGVGICPEGPTVDGTYQIAGMAYYAHTNDLQPAALEGNQFVTTYAVQLATNVPRIEIPVASTGGKVTLLPAYRLIRSFRGEIVNGGGTLAEFKVVQKHSPTATPGVFSGKFMVLWEDSEQGGDFDKDMWGVIEYELDERGATPTLKVTTDAVNEATAGAQLFGFIISGTTQDGFHAYSGIENARFADPLNAVSQVIPDCNTPVPSAVPFSTDPDTNCDVTDTPRSHVFTVGGATAEILPDPLLLAAKYGAFEDTNDNKLPDVEEEFDKRDLSGNLVTGGDLLDTPDTYFFVTNPAALERSLRSVFNQIIERVASGTAASVVAGTQEGTGAVLQALYDPVKTDSNGNEVKWIGTLHAIFIDDEGFLREDGNANDRLDNYNDDPRIEIFFDEIENRARLRRFTSSSGTEFVESGSSVAELNDLEAIWNAREELSALSNVTTQRAYGDLADTGRYIFTWLDEDYDGLIADDRSEEKAFDDVTFTDSNFAWVDVWDGVTKNDDEVDKLVNFIRGEEQTGYRSRTVDYDGDGTVDILRLGDVVNSTPIAEGEPSGNFDLLSQDESYFDFRERYRTRRSVVYVGGNDGMIHAFNGGFFDATTKEFKRQLTTEVAHPLGTELWAYVPKNLLGQLQWLADPDYDHVFYNDLQPFTFDARIFTDTSRFPAADYPGGWGTVLVVGMRLGGGTDANGIVLDTQDDGTGASNTDGDASDDVLTKSAYVVFDVTNPENPPRVLAELSPPGQYFTTAVPAAATIGEPLPSSAVSPDNDWYLMFGSGPTRLDDVRSEQNGRVFAYNLNELVNGQDGVVESGPFDSDNDLTNGIGYADTGDANTFVGEIVVADQDLDMKAEAIYFGTVGDESGTGGNLHRMTLDEEPDPSNWDDSFQLLSVNKPFSTRPSITIDTKNRTWIIAGTGRLYTNDDKAAGATQTLYGFIDRYSEPGSPVVNPASPTALDDSKFEDVTDAITFTNGAVDVDGDGTTETTFDDFKDTISADNVGGWFLDYEDSSSPSERTIANQRLFRTLIISTAFTPSVEQCGADGTSRLISRSFDNGLVPPNGVFGTICEGSCPDGTTEPIAKGTEDLGSGLASSTTIHIGTGGTKLINQDSQSEINITEIDTPPGQTNGEVSWQEFRSN